MNTDLERENFAKSIKTDLMGQSLYYYDVIDSTNLEARRMAAQGAKDGSVFVADAQTAGRGRRGRSWESPARANLYFTLLLRPKIAPDKASMLTLVMALAVAQGIQATVANADPQPGIKWPNDIVLDGRKVCGILTELSLKEDQTIDHLVIGVGINVRRQTFPEEIKATATSLENVYQSPIDRSKLLSNVLEAFESAYHAFMDAQSLAPLKEAYNALLVNQGRPVRVLDPKGEYEAVAQGILDTGELITELPTGELRYVYAGEVSVRGIYGYV